LTCINALQGRTSLPEPDQEAGVGTYDVSFYNNLVNDEGRCRRVLQRRVRIRSARDEGDAIRQAQRRFERLERLRDWRLHASDAEATVVR
jgi:hypothetical protein